MIANIISYGDMVACPLSGGIYDCEYHHVWKNGCVSAKWWYLWLWIPSCIEEWLRGRKVGVFMIVNTVSYGGMVACPLSDGIYDCEHHLVWRNSCVSAKWWYLRLTDCEYQLIWRNGCVSAKWWYLWLWIPSCLGRNGYVSAKWWFLWFWIPSHIEEWLRVR